MIHFDDYAHGYLIGDRSGARFIPDLDRCVSRTVDGKLVGGAIYKDYTGVSIAMHVAGFEPNWLSKELLWVGFHYPFIQLGCKTLFGQVSANNQTALEFDLKLGFSPTYRIADVYPDGDMILMTMRREDCRWLKLKPPVWFKET